MFSLNFKRIFKLGIILITILSSYKVFAFFSDSDEYLDFENTEKLVAINDNGMHFEVTSSAKTAGDLLKEKNIKIGEHDYISLPLEERIKPKTNIEIKRAVKVKIEVDGKIIEGYTLKRGVSGAIEDNGVTLGRLDKTSPEKTMPVQNNTKIIVTRINEEEKIIPEEIDFKTTVKNDSGRGWREKKIDQKGEKGIKEVKYKIVYRNGKEISRTILEKNITKDPVMQIEIQGTYVKLSDKKHTGQGTWYSHQGGLYAASPWLPIGAFAKVTNTANGKSVIVEINDRGPFGKGRIIDLDKPAWQKIAALGAGVIGVRVEEVLN